MLHGSPRGGGHGFDVEVLDPDHVEAASKAGGGLLHPVLATVAIPGLQPCDQEVWVSHGREGVDVAVSVKK
jgi:hypothetical protein